MPTPYICTTFEGLDVLDRERALDGIAFHPDCSPVRIELTGQDDGYDFLGTLDELGLDPINDAEVATRLSDLCREQNVFFDIMNGRIYIPNQRS